MREYKKYSLNISMNTVLPLWRFRSTNKLFENYLEIILNNISDKITLQELDDNFDKHINIERLNGLQEILEARQFVVIDEIVRKKNNINKLITVFFPDNQEIEEKEFQIFLSQIVPSFQAMLLYCRLTKSKFFYSIPFFEERIDRIENASLTVMSKDEFSINENLFDFGKNIFRPIFQKTEALKSHLDNKLSKEIAKRSLEDTELRDQISKILDSIFGRKDENHPEKDIKNLKNLLAELCILGSKLKNKKHEGSNLQFTFILAQVDSIGKRFKSIHSLGESIMHHLDLLKSFNTAKAIINGNFAFLQRDNIALFAPFPSGELSFTHIVDLDKHPISTEQYLDQRQNLLCNSSYGEEIYIVATFKEGITALYNNGKIVARTRQFSNEWEEYNTSKFNKYFSDLSQTISVHCKNEMKNIKNVDKLIEVVKAISENPNKGGMFIICDSMKFIDSERVRHMTEVFDLVEGKSLDKIDIKQLYELATQDGATIIDYKTSRITGRWQLPTLNPSKYKVANGMTVEDYLLKEFKDKPESIDNPLHKRFEWGSRHLSSWAITFGDIKKMLTGNEFEDAFNVLSICVSSDGPVFVFKEGKIIHPWPQS
jgi:hypothetical protein